MKQVGVILQAAGLSTRMGQNKCLLPWKHHTVIEEIADAFTNLSGPKVAVVGADAYEHMHSLLEPKAFTVIKNLHPENGQASSLRIGLESLQSFPELSGVFCAVADQPLLNAEVIASLCQKFTNEQDIICPVYGINQKRGNPVVFGSYWFKTLLALQGDVGGKQVLQKEGKKFIKIVPIKEEDIHTDIDTPEIYQQMVIKWGS